MILPAFAKRLLAPGTHPAPAHSFAPLQAEPSLWLINPANYHYQAPV